MTPVRRTLFALVVLGTFGLSGMLIGSIVHSPRLARAEACEFDICRGGDCIESGSLPSNCDETILGCEETPCGDPD